MARAQRRGWFQKTAGSGSVSPAIIISGMDRLRSADEDERADALLLRTVTEEPASAVGLLAVLRSTSRHADVEMLLGLIASTEPATCGTILHALRASGDAADAATLVELLHERSAADLAAAAAAFDRSASAAHESGSAGTAASAGPAGTAGPDPSRLTPAGNPLTAKLADHPHTDLITDLVRLREQHHDAEADVLLAVIGQGSPRTVYQAAAALAKQQLSAEAATLLVHYAADAAAADLAQLFLQLAKTWESAATHVAPTVAERPDVAALLAATQTLEPQLPPEACCGILADRLTVAQRLGLCRALTGQPVLADLLGWCARQDDAPQFQTMLHQAGMHAAAYHVAERRDETAGRYEA